MPPPPLSPALPPSTGELVGVFSKAGVVSGAGAGGEIGAGDCGRFAGRFFPAAFLAFFPAFLAGALFAGAFFADFFAAFLALFLVVFLAAFLAVFFETPRDVRFLAADFLAEALPPRFREPFDPLLDFFAGIFLVSFWVSLAFASPYQIRAHHVHAVIHAFPLISDP